MMSVTMLLRRSPELDVATLGHMNLISSNTLRPSATPPSRLGTPDHVVSNNSPAVHKEHVSMRAVPKGRNAVVPHTLHLRDLQGGNLGGESEGGGLAGSSDSGGKDFDLYVTMHGTQAWDSTQHGRATQPGTAKRAQHGGTQHAQHGMTHAASFANSKSAQASTAKSGKHVSVHARSDISPEDAAFDLYHHSQKLTMQLPASMQGYMRQVKGAVHSSHPIEGEAAAAEATDKTSSNVQSISLSHGESSSAAASDSASHEVVDSGLGRDSSGRAESAMGGNCLAQGARSTMQSPGLDSYEAEEAVVGAVDSQGSSSTQPFTVDHPLMHKSSTVRFMVGANRAYSPDTDVDSIPEPSTEADESQRTSPLSEAALNADIGMRFDDSSAACIGAGNRTVSSLSNNSSLKSALKQTLSSSSSADMISRSSSRLCESPSGVSFAVNGAESSGGDVALVKQGSESFPSWLTEGYAATSARSL